MSDNPDNPKYLEMKQAFNFFPFRGFNSMPGDVQVYYAAQIVLAIHQLRLRALSKNPPEDLLTEVTGPDGQQIKEAKGVQMLMVELVGN